MTFFKEQCRRMHSFYHGDFSYYLRITAAAFLTIVVVSFVFGMAAPDFSSKLVEQFAQQVSDLGILQGNATLLAAGLFANNLRVILIGIIYGLLPMVYLPALSLGINASMLGVFAAYSMHNGISLWQYALSILPHGIFELPALVISLAMGFYLCHCTTLRLRKKTQGLVKSALGECMRVVAMHIIPLLFVAAVIESFVTPRILELIH